MGWISFLIEHKGKKLEGHIDQDNMIFDVPFALGIKVGDVFTVNGQQIKALSVDNVGNRNETLIIKGEINGKSSKGGTPNKTGEKQSEGKTND